MTAGLVTQFNPVSEFVPMGQAKTGSSSENFADALKSSTDKNPGVAESNAVREKESANSSGSETVEKNTAKDVDSKNQTNDDNIDKVDETAETNKPSDIDNADSDGSKEDVAEEVLEAAAEVIATLANVLNALPEDVTDALERLGLNQADILDEANIPQVTIELSDATDVTDIMTDEALFAEVKELTEAVNETQAALAEKIGIDKDAVKPLINDVAEEINRQIEDITGEEAKLKIDIDAGNRAERENTGAGQENGSSQMNFAEQFVNEIRNINATAGEEQISAYSTSMEDIYSQVSESLKLNMQEDVTEMEMTLHPASLGNVKVQLAAKEGVVTANFVTQNEQVKAALETQIVELKNNMNEQGIKVEAIEVTVASHAFEENLSNEGRQADGEQESENKKRRRIINLNEIDDSDDNIIEDDIRIAREMMMHNGTTVDYMA